jgi:DNA helicase-2/ATP-dependent DNA helicase PcrA
MDLLASLNPQQRVAVEHGKGPALVLAGAGSGKTRVITHRIAYLIRNAAARPENILAVTFTNKAAAEMRDRVQRLTPGQRSSEPLISTFHSFCVRLLRREIEHLGYRRDFSIYDADDQKHLIKQILQESGMPEGAYTPREVLSRISYAKNHDVTPERYAVVFDKPFAEDMAKLFKLYNDRLRQSNALDFDDLLLMAVDLLGKKPELCDYYGDWYRYVLVDEYQDTNRPQFELLSLLTAKHKNLFVVGDEDQSIYRFRGADIQNILRFEKEFPGARVIRLEQNYRSTQNILSVAGAVVGHNTERKGKILWTENAGGDVATCHRAQSARDEADWVARRIEETLADNPEQHIAVLYRTNFLSRNFEEVLTELGIPYAVVGSVAFFGRMEVKDMLAYLRILFNPEDDVALLRIINTPPRAIGGTTVDMLTHLALEREVPITQVLRDMTKDPQTAGRSSKALVRFQEMLDRWMVCRDTRSKADLLKAILEDTKYRQMLEKEESPQEAESRMANIEELIRAASESEERGETVFEFLDRASLSSELDRFDPDAKVALMTVHSAKGLEFDVVFLAGLEEGLFPHAQSKDTIEDLEEERRLCYVGITRSRHKLFLTWTPFRRSFGPESGMVSLPSRFLLEMPANLIEGLDTSIHYTSTHGSSYRRRQRVEEALDESYEYREKTVAEEEPQAQPKSLAELRAYLQSVQGTAGREAGRGPGFRSGSRVRHPQFGDGIVLSRERAGNDIKLTIAFSRVGRKTLVERYAKLQPL